jgi:Uma2 family endonuclease
MTTPTEAITTPPAGQTAVLADLFRYGWRYVRRQLPDSGEVFEQVPLTLEDLLHPEEGDQVTHNKQHQRICRYLVDALESRLAGDPTAVVLDDVRIAWDAPDLKPHGPDIAVVFGVRDQRNWSTFDVAQEGVRPTLIIEVTSPETRVNDFVTKRDEYGLAGVPHYVVVDVHEIGKRAIRQIFGYQLSPTGYQAVAPNERGCLWMAPVSLWIGFNGERLECYDEAGVLIGDYGEITAALIDAEARLRELEAELRRLRGES